MDYRLRIFVTVAEKENFTSAAKMLFITQSAVSLQIKSLEKRYGVKLFDRNSKPIRLTKAGVILYTHAKNILKIHDQVKTKIDDLYFEASGQLNIGSSYTFGEYLLPELIAGFIEMYPNIIPSVSIRNSKSIANLVLQHDIDIGILEGHYATPGLDIESFMQDEMVIIVPSTHRLANEKEVDLSDLSLEKWILREKGSGTREMTDYIFENNGFEPNKFMEFGSSQLVKEAVQRELGISIISKLLIVNKVSFGLLKPLRIKNNIIKRNIYYTTNDNQNRTKATELFMTFLNENNKTIMNYGNFD